MIDKLAVSRPGTSLEAVDRWLWVGRLGGRNGVGRFGVGRTIVTAKLILAEIVNATT